MAKVSNIDFSLISSVSGIQKSLISKISNIPFSSAPTCSIFHLGYADGKKTPIEASCTAEFFPYDFDGSTGILYSPNGCGVSIAPIGYYSDGVTIYIFDGASFVPFSSCRR